MTRIFALSKPWIALAVFAGAHVISGCLSYHGGSQRNAYGPNPPMGSQNQPQGNGGVGRATTNQTASPKAANPAGYAPPPSPSTVPPPSPLPANIGAGPTYGSTSSGTAFPGYPIPPTGPSTVPGGGPMPGQTVPTQPAPTKVHIIFNGAWIAPAKSNGCQWDGLTCNSGGSSKALQAVSSALAAANPPAAVFGALAGPAAQSLEKPDPAGTATLFVRGQQNVASLSKKQDSFTPTWDVQWQSVTLDDSVRLHVTLIDKDIQNDDDIGSFMINASTLRAALQQGTAYQVRVREQTNQVLFAQISVIPTR